MGRVAVAVAVKVAGWPAVGVKGVQEKAVAVTGSHGRMAGTTVSVWTAVAVAVAQLVAVSVTV